MNYPNLIVCVLMLLCVSVARADGLVVDKVYHPYVLPNEREIEWRFARRDDDGNNLLLHRLGFGHSLTEYLSVEAYLIGERTSQEDFKLQSYEIEARWMLTDQGRYWIDLGALFEVERDHDEDNWEVSAALLLEKEIGRTSLTINTFLVYEWGDTINNEWETELRLQYRYRLRPQFQPAIELYTGEDYRGIGPAVIGIQRFDGQKQLKWEVGYIFGLGQDNGLEGNTFRFALEYEF